MEIQRILREIIFVSFVPTVMHKLTRTEERTLVDPNVLEEKNLNTHLIVQKSGFNRNVSNPCTLIRCASRCRFESCHPDQPKLRGVDNGKVNHLWRCGGEHEVHAVYNPHCLGK